MAAFGSAGAAVGALIGGPVGGVVGSLLGGLLGGGVDPRIALIDNTVRALSPQQAVVFLTTWINDQPPHPRDSVAHAQQVLAQLTGGVMGGRIAVTPGATPSVLGQPAQQLPRFRGAIPVTLPNGAPASVLYF